MAVGYPVYRGRDVKMIKIYLGGLLLFLLAALLSLGSAEFASRHLLFTAEERAAGAASFWEKNKNSYTDEFGKKNNCTLAESLVRHPYLAFVLRHSGHCGSGNSIGMHHSENFPSEREPNFFTIVVLGGSVASALAWQNPEGYSELSEALNKKFLSPNGKPFRVTNGASGSWSYPLQINFLTLYGHAVDAAVSLDGYNEAVRASGGNAITSPATQVYLAIASPTPFRKFGLQLASFISYRTMRTSLRNSFLMVAIFRSVLTRLNNPPEKIAHMEHEILGRFFDFPTDWDQEKITQWNQQKYRSYIRELAAISGSQGLRYAHFVQPTRFFGKQLTPEEKSYVEPVDQKIFRSVILDASAIERKAGYATHSLENVFAGEIGTIFSDSIHFAFESPGKSRGYRLVAEAMALELGKMWKLKPRPKAERAQ